MCVNHAFIHNVYVHTIYCKMFATIIFVNFMSGANLRKFLLQIICAYNARCGKLDFNYG